MSEDLETRRRRAQFRASHRGTKEMDWLLGRFADAELGSMNGADLELFEALLREADPALHGWLMHPDTCEVAGYEVLVTRIRNFHGLN
ncbi:MAG: succinate dehydrogenase assembly factor 2 [Hyphomicrobiaceae bacterium]